MSSLIGLGITFLLFGLIGYLIGRIFSHKIALWLGLTIGIILFLIFHILALFTLNDAMPGPGPSNYIEFFAELFLGLFNLLYRILFFVFPIIVGVKLGVFIKESRKKHSPLQ